MHCSLLFTQAAENKEKMEMDDDEKTGAYTYLQFLKKDVSLQSSCTHLCLHLFVQISQYLI